MNQMLLVFLKLAPLIRHLLSFYGAKVDCDLRIQCLLPRLLAHLISFTSRFVSIFILSSIHFVSLRRVCN